MGRRRDRESPRRLVTIVLRPRASLFHAEGGWFSANWHFSFDPSIEQREFPADARRNVLKAVLAPATGFGGDDAPTADDAVTVHQDAAVYAGRLDPKKKVRHQFRPGFGGYLFVVHGTLVRPELDEGGAAKILNEPAIDLEAGPQGAEVLLVETRTSRA